MARRAPVDSGLTPERFAPRSSPVDTFTGRPKTSGLSKLAEGLSTLAPTLERFTDQTLAREKEEQTLAGQREAQKLIESRKSFKEAEAEGLIRKDQSPWFRFGMKQQFADVAADHYAAHLSAAASEWLEAGETDPSAFIEREAELRRQWVAENVGEGNRDPVFDKVFATEVNNRAAGVAQGFAKGAGANAVEASSELLGQKAFGLLRNVEGLSREELVQSLTGLGAWGVQEQGLNGTRVNKELADAIVDFAVAEGDYEVLDLLDEIKTGSGNLGDIQYARDIRREAERAVMQKREASWAHEARRADHESRTALTEASTALSEAEDPYSVDVEPWAAVIEKTNPALANALRELPSQRASLSIESDVRLVDRLRGEILQGDLTMKGLLDRHASGEINGRDLQDLMGTLSTWNNYQQSIRSGGEDPFKDTYLQDSFRHIRAVAGASESQLAALEDFEIGGRIRLEQARQANSWARGQYLQWYYSEAGQAASPEERRQEADRVFEATRQKFFPWSEKITESQQQAVTLNRPLAWQKERILDAAEVREVRNIVTGQQNDLSDPLFQKLTRYGVGSRAETMEEFMEELRLVYQAQANLYTSSSRR